MVAPQVSWDATMMRLRLPLDADTRGVLVQLANKGCDHEIRIDDTHR